jgi:hypothetical protein
LDFLNRHTFAEIFPVLDLSKPEHALFAVRSTLRVLANPGAFINLCGYGPALMDRLREWLMQSAPANLKSQLKPELAKVAQTVQGTNLSEEVRAAFQSVGMSDEIPFQYGTYDPMMEIARHVTRRERAGKAEEASILRRYIERISPRISDQNRSVSRLLLAK